MIFEPGALMKNVTINTIAKEAGVSIKTVSRVFNQEPNVRPATRDKVLQAARKLNYRPNMAARSLASNKSYVIVHFYDNPSPDYLERAHEGIHKTCRANGYFAVMEPVTPAKGAKRTYAEEVGAYIRQFSIDGIILTPPLSDDPALMAVLDGARMPYVRISPHYAPQKSSCVCIDERAAARLMTRHLVALHHKRIAFIAGPPAHGAAKARQNGFEDVLGEAGLERADCPVLQGDFSFRSGFSAFETLVRNGPVPGAIFAANDDMAAGVMVAAMKAGLDIPADLSVAGYDGSRIGEILWPALTTIRQPVRAMAERATALLLQHIRNPAQEAITEQLPVSLLDRASTGAA